MTKGAPKPRRVEVRVRVTPKASRSRWEAGDPVRVWVTAPPADGQANEALIVLLAQALGVAKTSVTIVRGEASRDKVIAFASVDESEVRKRLQRAE